jgi:hypothetical protein
MILKVLQIKILKFKCTKSTKTQKWKVSILTRLKKDQVTHSKMDPFTLDNGWVWKDMELAYRNGAMVLSTKATGLKTWHKDLVHFITQMVTFMKENGKKTKLMVKEHIGIKTEPNM